MRTKEEILKEFRDMEGIKSLLVNAKELATFKNSKLQLEVLLDIRELFISLKERLVVNCGFTN